jgi:hypothetical protein
MTFESVKKYAMENYDLKKRKRSKPRAMTTKQTRGKIKRTFGQGSFFD